MRHRHDILHCRNTRCKLREACERWLAWKEVEGTEMEERVMVSKPKRGGCMVQWCQDFLHSDVDE